MYPFITNLNSTLEAQLQIIQKEEPDILKKALQARDCVRNALKQLKAFVLEYAFESKEEEISFFKKLKPELQSRYIYYNKIVEFESLRPVGSAEEQEKYLKECLHELTIFFYDHKEFYQYHRMELTHFDDKYFLRGETTLKYKTKNADIEEKFCTSHDYLLAKIIAYDQLEIYLNTELQKIARKSQNPPMEHLWFFEKFKWTGKKIFLQELTYSIAEAKVINNGECTINELSELFEEIFNIDLKDSIYRSYQEIKHRSNPTKFLDKLRDLLRQKIEDDDG